ncbi:hypothetical protein APHAL10511_001827 [Amanita phalloides]|nr:hypothetical protein APHAL10511_001827 [Amanita phalloides]
MSDHDFLAVLKASYDYQAQSDDELSITENQFLLLLDRVDDDWWRVKVKSNSQDDDGPSGLVPAAYVESADHVSTVKVIYDYQASSPGELTVKEDEILMVYETDQDWLLVQSQEGGMAGYVPGNYVETVSDADSPAPPAVNVPSTRPVSTYVDPADRVASFKASQPRDDPIETWSVTDIDKKKKKKGTLGVGNGAIFFASESDKTPVQKWQTIDVQDVLLEKNKQIRINVGGANPITLHYNAGSKENAEAIQGKVQLSKSISQPRVSHDLSPETERTSSPPPTTSGRKVGRKASVHFSQSDPVIIPSKDEEELDAHYVNDEEERDQNFAVALYDFTADGDDELTAKGGEQLVILEKDSDEWWKCRNSRGEEGVVPASYLEETTQPVSSPPYAERKNVDKESAEAETATAAAAKAAVEAEERAEEERREREEELSRARKKQEAQRRAREAAAAVEAEQKRRKETVARVSSSPAQTPDSRRNADDRSTSRSSELNRPPPDEVRTWHDRSGQFRVDAAFLGLSNDKVRLHKVNGVVVEVPTEKMSVDDIRHIEKLTSRKTSKPSRTSDDDVPLALTRPQPSSTPQRTSTPKKSNIDWFDFFLSAGCDVDDCSRYANAFEKDKIDETLLSDITESTMRTLGLREGDIIRVIKAIEKKKKPESRNKATAQIHEQIRRDEELARQIEAQETGGASSPKSPAPNLFTGPGGVLKAPRRRPQPSKTLPPSVDINALSSVSSQTTGSPQGASPTATTSSSTLLQLPTRTTSAALPVSGFDDDAWTNRPSSTKPITNTPPATIPRAPSAPPANPTVPTPIAATPTPPPQLTAVNAASTTSQTNNASLAKTTEVDVFDQLARLSELRKPATLAAVISKPSPTTTAPPPASFHAGLGMGSSNLPIAQHLQNQQLQVQQSVLSTPSPQLQLQPQLLNVPRGPYAPVPSNQGLLQPLVPTRTGFGGFVPTRANINPNSAVTLSTLQINAQPALTQQLTGLPHQMLLPQATGVSTGSFTPSPFQNTGNFGPGPVPLQPQFTGFNPNLGSFTNNSFAAPPVPPLPISIPASNSNNTSPANVFAQMKSRTFANEDTAQPQPSVKYDALRPAPLTAQSTGWAQPYQSQFTGYPR